MRYTRVMDWDIPPTEFVELVTHGGVVAALGIPSFGSPKLLAAHDNGFDTPDPYNLGSEIVPGTLNTDFVRSGPADHGSRFTFGFGDIPNGRQVEFQIFYGAAASESLAISALQTVGAEVFSLGQCETYPECGEITYIFGFKGVGGRPLPRAALPAPAVSPSGLLVVVLLLLGGGLYHLRRLTSQRAANGFAAVGRVP